VGNSAGAGTTPVTPGGPFKAAAPDSTKTAQHRLPVNRVGPLTLTRRTPTAGVPGPAAWENGRDPVATPAGQPPLAGATARDVHPCPAGRR